MATIGERLKLLLDERDMTQGDLAKELSVVHATVSHYCSDKRIPDAKTLERLADFFAVSVDYLLGRTIVKAPIETIAAHRDGEGDWTEEELEDIEQFKEFVRMKREKRGEDK